jgi:DNA modification methylase
MPEASVHCCVTSPPYWGLRDYGVPGQIGLEASVPEWIERVVDVFREVRRVLRKDGTVWLNLGDCFVAAPAGMDRSEGPASTLTGADRRGNRAARALPESYGKRQGHRSSFRRDREPLGGMPHKRALKLKPKDLVGQPWRLAFALQDDGWWLRRDLIWHKPNAMPESVRDRPSSAHEYVFLLARSRRYYYDAAAIAEPLAESSIVRLSQPTFDQQHGGPKDYGGDRSQRRALENLAARHKPPSGWNDGPTADDKVGRYRRSGNGARDRGERAGATSDVGRGVQWEGSEAGRNSRSVWTIPTQPYPGPHYATFPEELARRCVLAGSPPRTCEQCGAPWRRELRTTHRNDQRADGRPSTGNNSGGRRGGPAGHGSVGMAERTVRHDETVGWRPGCKHDQEGRGVAMVLDPFGGSGTVAQVATGHGRASTWIDLDPDNVPLALERIGPLLCDVVGSDGRVLYGD